MLNVDLFDTLLETRVKAKCGTRHYHAVCPHSARGYRPPAPDAVLTAIHFRPFLSWELARFMEEDSSAQGSDKYSCFGESDDRA
ncbi:MAG: hypothetical protein GY758_25770 [Fuerstiella sp.]|nr:hypothetical protein [Fuerstiella sp.]